MKLPVKGCSAVSNSSDPQWSSSESYEENMETAALTRPKTLTPEMAARAAKKVAARLAHDGHIGKDEIETCASDIAECGRLYGQDGYQLAKELDDNHYWDCNLMVAETLEEFSGEARREIEAAEKVWFFETKPQPQFANGTRITVPHGETGVIDGIYEYGVGKYTVKIDGDKDADTKMQSRRIVNFEDAERAP